MNALEIIREACGVIGITRPNSIVGSSDTGVAQLVGLLNKEGAELAKRSSVGWQALVREATFTTVADEDQGSLESIIGAANAYRHIVNDTIWNRSLKEPIFGPKAPRVWQGYKAFAFSGPYYEYRIRGGRLLFFPAPQAGETCAFEYVTNNWLTSADGSQQRSRVADDEDITLLDEQIILRGIEWRWRASKGLEYGEDFRGYEAMVFDALARDGTKPRKDLAGVTADQDIPLAIPRLVGL